MKGKMQKAGGWHDSDEMDYGLSTWISLFELRIARIKVDRKSGRD